ncbi:TniQ family protein [Sphingomonas antarctica]|uniref:TniQ family protein n=1 Tax=Sphingomonas antarctica TaxID=2040274 RepID=UPI0039E9D2C1
MITDSPTAAPLSRVPHFPTVYDDELLYSIVARYGVMTGYIESSSANLDLFGTPFGHGSARAPSALDAMASRLPLGLNLDARELVTRHTLLPYYYAFFPDDRQEKAIGEALARHGRADKAAGMEAKPLSPPRRLKFCPECLDVMELRKQELHWKRVHQLAIVMLCPDHGSDLRFSSITPHPADRLMAPATRANCAPDAPIGTASNMQIDREALLGLACGARTLLNGGYPANATREKASGLAQLFRDLGYKRSSRINWEMLQPEVQKVVSGVTAVIPGIERAGARDDGWFDHAMDPRRIGRSDRVLIAAMLIDRIEAVEPRFWAAIDKMTGKPFMDLPATARA